MQPNLFIAGFQKCGSSSLFQLLGQHPQVCTSNPKETFALTDDSYENYSFEKSIHNEDFKWDVFFEPIRDVKYYLEASVCNFYQQTALEYISNLPEKKVIFIVRNPIDRFVSTYYYYGGNGVHLHPDVGLEEYFTLVKNGGAFMGKEGLKFAIEHGKYLQYIEKWRDSLGAGNVLVIGFKQLIREPIKTSETIFDFLGIERLGQIDLKHENKTMVSRAPGLNRFLVKAIGGKNLVPGFAMRAYRKIINKPVKKEKLSNAQIQELELIYRDEFNELAGML